MDSVALPPIVEMERNKSATADSFFALLYSELHKMAKRQLARHDASSTLGATTLLHKTYISLAERTASVFPDDPRFLGYAARVMRGLIIDYARHRRVQKRGGMFEITSLEADLADNSVDNRELVQIGESLDELAKVDAALAELVDLKFFCGFSFSEIAAMRNVSERTVQRNWEKARLYLHRSIRPDLAL